MVWGESPTTSKGCDLSSSETAEVSFRRTALTKGAAERLRARLTSSTLSLIAARAGIRVSQRS